MNRIFALALVVTVFAPVARAEDTPETNLAISTVATTVLPLQITFAPFALSSMTTWLSSSCAQNNTCKINVIKRAAVESSEVLNGAAPGPYLMSIQDMSPDMEMDEIVEVVLEAAEQL